MPKDIAPNYAVNDKYSISLLEIEGMTDHGILVKDIVNLNGAIVIKTGIRRFLSPMLYIDGNLRYPNKVKIVDVNRFGDIASYYKKTIGKQTGSLNLTLFLDNGGHVKFTWRGSFSKTDKNKLYLGFFEIPQTLEEKRAEFEKEFVSLIKKKSSFIKEIQDRLKYSYIDVIPGKYQNNIIDQSNKRLSAIDDEMRNLRDTNPDWFNECMSRQSELLKGEGLTEYRSSPDNNTEFTWSGKYNYPDAPASKDNSNLYVK